MAGETRRDLRYRQQRDRYRELAHTLAALLVREGIDVDLAEHFDAAELQAIRRKIRLMV